MRRSYVRTLQLAIVICALVFVTRPAHAVLSAIGFVGYGHTFGNEGNGLDDNFGPTIEIGGSFGVPFIDIDVTYWNVLNDAGHQSQIRGGVRVSPPIIPFYGRLAAGIPFDSDVRDVLGVDIIFGAGFTAFELPLLKVNVELDYHYWTDASSIHPFEIKAGVAIGF
jgi:hypothetical protein